MIPKFKAWVEREKRMYEVITSGYDFRGTGELVEVDCLNPLGAEYDALEFRGTEIELLQSTGLKDRNGVEIYEGDIIPYHFNEKTRGVVKYGEYRNPIGDDSHGGHVGFYVDFPGNIDMRKDLGYWAKVSCVVGNIYEHGEV